MKNHLTFCKAPQIDDPAKIVRHVIFALVLMFSSPVVFAQDIVIKGKVTDYSNNQPVQFVTISVLNSSIGTTTDQSGRFSLRVPPNAKLVFSNTGYDSKTVPAGSSAELNIVLVPNVHSLDDVVVVGYGSARKRDLTGSVGSIRTEKLEKEKPISIQDLLRSGVPGLNVSFSNSAKGGGDVTVRGQRSLNANNNPLIVVDNVIFFGELSEINPMDVEQIDVLKDASAAAIYGAKSANGVVIIITKKGKSEKPTVRFDAGLSAVTLGPKSRKVYGPEGYLRYRSDLFASNDRYTNPGKFERPTAENLANAGITLAQWRAYTTTTGTDDEIWLQRINLYDYERKNFAAGKTFDWYDDAFRTGLNQDYNITLSGRKDKVSYYWSTGRLNSQGIIAGDNYNTWRSNLKLDANVTNFLDVGINLNFQNRTDGNLATDRTEETLIDWSKQILNNSPYAQPRDSNDVLIINPMGTGLNRGFNPAFDNQYRQLQKGYTTFNTIGYAKVKLPFNITYTLNFSPRFQQFHNRYHESSQHPDWRSSHNGYVVRENTKKYEWQIDNIINWEYKFAGVHDVKLTLLQNSEEHRSWNEKMEARDFSPSDVLGIGNVSGANFSKSTLTSKDEHSTGDALMARLFYGYDNRYMTTLTVRRDGYSAFGLSNPRATFYSASFAWTFYNEKFITWDALSAGKLRVSWGKNGNRDIGIYTALSDLTTGSGKYPYVTSAGGVVELAQLFVNRMANPALKWEATSAYNAILDFGFFKNRITGSVEVYHMPTTDLIMDQTLVDITGFTKITSNLGEVVNRGLEVTINTANVKTSNFSWNTTLGLSMNRNRIKHLYYVYEDVLDVSGKVVGSKEQDVIANGWFVGQDISTIWNYKTEGIWQENERAEAAKYGLIPGDAKIKDNYNPDAKKYTNEDKEFLGSRNPQYRFFLRNEFSFLRNFTTTVNLYGHLGHKQETYEYMNNDGFMTDRTNYYVREYWTPGSPSNKYARLNSTNPQNVGPPLVLSKSFVRLESISLSYSLPARMIKSIAAQQVRLYGGVRNVALWTKDWNYWDPEAKSSSKTTELNGPSPRTFTLGASVTF